MDRMKKKTVQLVAVIVGFICVSPGANSDLLTSCNVDRQFSVKFPDGAEKSTTVTPGDLYKHFNPKSLPVGVKKSNYSIDIWVYTGLMKFGISFNGVSIRNQNKHRSKAFPFIVSINQIEDLKNGVKGSWNFFVNGKRSELAINQLPDDCRYKKLHYEYRLDVDGTKYKQRFE